MGNDSPLWFKVEQEIVNLLLYRLENLEITPERAQQIAKFVVKAIPTHLTDQQMLDIIPHLDDQFIELASVVHNHLGEYEKSNAPIVKEEVEELMREGNFQEAITLTQKYFANKI